MRILVDIDETIRDTLSEILLTYKYEINPQSKVKYTDVKDWDLNKILPGLGNKETFFRKYAARIFKAAYPLPFAIEGLNEIARDHEIFLVSAQYPGLEEQTIKWLRQYKVPYDSLIFTYDKSAIKGDVIIDDKLSNLEHPTAKPICMLQPYNKNKYNTYPSVNSMYEAKSLIDEIEKCKH